MTHTFKTPPGSCELVELPGASNLPEQPDAAWVQAPRASDVSSPAGSQAPGGADLRRLYEKIFPEVARYIARRGGSFEQARDIFHDALLAYYEKSRFPGFQIEQSPASYIFGICKYRWLREYSGESLKSEAMRTIRPEEPDPAPSEKKLLSLLASAGRKCMELLKSYYYDNLSMPELAFRFGFSGKRSATVQKFKCLEKVRNTVKEKSLDYESFLE